jgi:hypothetical protein
MLLLLMLLLLQHSAVVSQKLNLNMGACMSQWLKRIVMTRDTMLSHVTRQKCHLASLPCVGIV